VHIPGELHADEHKSSRLTKHVAKIITKQVAKITCTLTLRLVDVRIESQCRKTKRVRRVQVAPACVGSSSMRGSGAVLLRLNREHQLAGKCELPCKACWDTITTLPLVLCSPAEGGGGGGVHYYTSCSSSQVWPPPRCIPSCCAGLCELFAVCVYILGELRARLLTGLFLRGELPSLPVEPPVGQAPRLPEGTNLSRGSC